MPKSRVASIFLLIAVLAGPARAQGYGPCGGFVTHLWVPQLGGNGGSITIGGGSYSGGGTSGGGTSSGGDTHAATPVGGGSSSGGSSGGGGSGDGAAILVL